MSKVIVTQSKLTAIADATRARFGVSGELTLDEIAEIITPPKEITPHWNASEITSGTSITHSLTNCSVGNLLICCFAVRSNFSLSSGWTTISSSNYISALELNQKLGWAYKTVESTTESITINVQSSGRIYSNLIELPAAAQFTDNGYSYYNSTNTIATAKNNDLVIWATTAVGWATSDLWTCSSINASNKLIQLSSNPRLFNVLDDSTASSVTFKAPTATAMILGSLTITGIPYFDGGH